MDASAIAAARRLHTALEAGSHGEDLRDLFTEDAVTLEHPNLVKPKGARAEIQKILASSSAGADLLREQHYDVTDAVEVGDLAIIRLTWTGVVGRDIGPFQRGQELTAHIAQFITVRKGRIAKIETYDCYEPL